MNQALIFYHYGSVDDLLTAACTISTAERVQQYADQFATVASLRELLAVGRTLHAEERRLGNLSVLAQLLAAAQNDPKFAAATGAALDLWIVQIESVLHRLLTGTPFAEVADIPGLARAISAAFIGLELYEGVAPTDALRAIAALDQLAVLVEVIDELGPIARRALQAKIGKATTRRTRTRPPSR